MIAERTTQNPLIVPAGTGRYGDLGDHRFRIKVSARDTGGAFFLLDGEMDPDGRVPPHIHTREDETFYILSGRFDFRVGDRAEEVGPGDTVFAPRNVAHNWRCVSPEGGRALILLTPGSNFEAFVLAMAENAVVPSDPDSLARLVRLTERHGIQMLPVAP